MSSLLVSEKLKVIKMFSAALVINTLRVNQEHFFLLSRSFDNLFGKTVCLHFVQLFGCMI